MKVVTVRKVNSLRGSARAEVLYCGRAFAGWPASRYGNHNRTPCPDEFRAELLARPDLDEHLGQLWEACQHGALPLGCWCCDWHGTGPTPACHACVYAELLNQRSLGEIPA
jgi:hypothetical protein